MNSRLHILSCFTKDWKNKKTAAVSSVREPIEALFGWLIEKTNIQRAQTCRSTTGLLIHTLGKLAIAFIFLIFNY